VENLTGEFKLGDIKDEARAMMLKMIAAKQKGEKITASSVPDTKVTANDLMETLKATAKATAMKKAKR
jgi:non-homologous end joining protein Ku